MKAREQALFAALDDMESWLATGVHCSPMESCIVTPTIHSMCLAPCHVDLQHFHKRLSTAVICNNYPK